ncbi:MAG: prepilin-type N-terminal cleavage/methylation domain-containing protein [Acidobacteriia bacterium]|nr:prepilin-type N-terminal cleavage/methylation domain-containing protein [Terriglobia bacterium]
MSQFSQGRIARRRRAARGFSMIEALVTVAIIMILTAAAVPIIRSSVRVYQLRSAVAGVRSLIQSTRYRAISDGYPYQVVFNAAAGTAQVQNNPNFTLTPTTFTNVGSAVPLTGSSVQVTMSADTTLQFRPGGLVVPTVGTNTFSITLLGSTKTFTVSTYGNVNVQ